MNDNLNKEEIDEILNKLEIKKKKIDNVLTIIYIIVLLLTLLVCVCYNNFIPMIVLTIFMALYRMIKR